MLFQLANLILHCFENNGQEVVILACKQLPLCSFQVSVLWLWPCMCPAQGWGVLPKPVPLGFCGVLTQPWVYLDLFALAFASLPGENPASCSAH